MDHHRDHDDNDADNGDGPLERLAIFRCVRDELRAYLQDFSQR